MAAGNVNTDNANLGPKVAATTHPLYQLMKPTWTQLAHVREGTGGFLDGLYLVAHPREYLDHTIVSVDSTTQVKTSTPNPNPKKPSRKLIARRQLARYENIASGILEAKKSALFREQPTRRVGTETGTKTTPTELEQWWNNVDRDGMHIDDAVKQWWDLAATLGHVVLYMDTTSSQADAETAADESAPYVRVYTPLDVLDWRRDSEGELVWIKLLEATQAPSTGQLGDIQNIATYQIRVVDETSWTLYDFKSGKYLSQGQHQMGKLPVAYLFGKRRSLLADIGESLLGDPRNHIDIFNLTSELRELLRNEAFSVVNVPLGSGDTAMTVNEAQAMMGSQTGTNNVLFSGLPAQMLSGSPGNVQSYHDEITRLKREIFRESGVQWVTDSRDAEAAQALELKRDEMDARLSSYADEIQKTEKQIADLWYRAKYGAETGPQKLEQDELVIHYPEHFSPTPFKEVLEQVEAAQAIGMPSIFIKELQKAIVSKFEGMGNLTQDVLDKITKAIDAAPDEQVNAVDRVKQKMDAITQGMKAGVPTIGANNVAPGTAA